MSAAGSLVCIGIGMTLGSHLTPLARNCIVSADVVFAAVSDALAEAWITQMHPDVRSLQPYYSEGKSRLDSYREMVAAMLAEVRKGQQVCAAFYGHPGVFAWPAHRAIEAARAEGFRAYMEPGISAADCLYADLGIDPGRSGCQHYEASQLMLYRRQIDSSAYLVVWQIGVAGDRSLRRFETGPEYRNVLLEVLLRDYPADHQVILYEAATLPTQRPRMEQLQLSMLPTATFDLHATLVVPPARALQPDRHVRACLARLDATSAGS
jgi:precorrin-6B methylase 1